MSTGDIPHVLSVQGEASLDTYKAMCVFPEADFRHLLREASAVNTLPASVFPATIDLSRLNGSDGVKLYGEAAYDSSGFPVASAGDVNGDGFEDLIVGASSNYASEYSSFAANLDPPSTGPISW